MDNFQLRAHWKRAKQTLLTGKTAGL